MGTESTITFISRKSGKDYPLVTIYQPFDGYLEGVGQELAEWLVKKRMINGISSFEQYKIGTYVNGAACLAAQFIREFKTEVGGLYIATPGCRKDYNYDVYIESQKDPPVEGVWLNNITTIKVTNYNHPKVIFEGSPRELLDYIKMREFLEEEDDI